MKRSFIREILESINEETISFAGGLPDDKLFPLEGMQEAASKAMLRSSNLQYSTSGGIMPLREKIAELHTEEGFPTEAENILITTGSQQGLYAAAKHFEERQIVIESPSYLGAVNIFRANNMYMLSVPLTQNGIDIELFAEKLHRAKLTYLIPDFQNPTGHRHSLENRQQTADVVYNNRGLIIEDAPYNELYFDERYPSISSMIPDNSIYMGSFSKTLTPGLRIGWVRAKKEIIDRLTAIKETIDLHTSTVTQHILYEFLKDDVTYKEHKNMLRREYKSKMEVFANALRKYLPDFEFTNPSGGMFIYGRLKGVDTYDMIQECMKEKVVFVPGNQFYNDRDTCDEIRFNFTHSSPEIIEEGLKRIRNIYESVHV
jgi:2-aminoadipate transaminase